MGLSREGRGVGGGRGRVQELCESPGGCPGLPVPNKPHAFCGRKATLNQSMEGGGGGAGRDTNKDSQHENHKCVHDTRFCQGMVRAVVTDQ